VPAERLPDRASFEVNVIIPKVDQIDHSGQMDWHVPKGVEVSTAAIYAPGIEPGEVSAENGRMGGASSEVSNLGEANPVGGEPEVAGGGAEPEGLSVEATGTEGEGVEGDGAAGPVKSGGWRRFFSFFRKRRDGDDIEVR
jgi:hypothetical protein